MYTHITAHTTAPEMTSNTPTLRIAETFGLTSQMEGRNTGMPAWFIRLGGCNLSCGMSKNAVQKIREKIDTCDKYIQGGFNQEDADLYNQGKATWVCDSITVWLKHKPFPVSAIIDAWKKSGVWKWVGEGRVSIVWTGGEPTMPKHQKDIVAAIRYIKQKYTEEFNVPCKIYNELETNGTYYITEELACELKQINCSVKLENSGMTTAQRIVPDALRRIVELRGDFKFVVSEEKDMLEIERDFIKPFNVPFETVYLQPGLDKQENAIERTKFAYEMAQKYGYRAGSRFQILLHGQATAI